MMLRCCQGSADPAPLVQQKVYRMFSPTIFRRHSRSGSGPQLKGYTASTFNISCTQWMLISIHDRLARLQAIVTYLQLMFHQYGEGATFPRAEAPPIREQAVPAKSSRGYTLQELKASLVELRNTPQDELQQWFLASSGCSKAGWSIAG